MGMPDHLTCFLSNLHASQEATVRTGSKLGKEYINTLYCHPAYLTYMQSESESCSVLSDALQPHGLYSPWNSPGQNTGVGSLSLLPGDLPNTGIEPRSPTLQVDSLPAEPQGKTKSTGVGSLSLLQQIFLIQESNQGLLHCRQILYQLSYQESPNIPQ